MRRLLLVLPVLLALIAFARVGGPAADAGVPPASSMLLDCDTATAGVQSSCIWVPGTSRDVDIVIRNDSASSVQIGNFSLDVLNADSARLFAPQILPSGAGFNGNPDTNSVLLPGGWACSPPAPVNDTDADGNPATQQSSIQCFNGLLDGAFIAPGGTLKVATVHYNVSPMPQPGSVALTIENGIFSDFGLTTIGMCNPAFAASMNCVGATIVLPQLTMSLDCNTAIAGVQSTCNVSNMGTTRNVDVVLRNNGPTTFALSAFDIFVINPDIARLLAPVINPPGDLNDNPDASPSMMPSQWTCSPMGPSPDANTDGDPATQESFIFCTTTAMLNIGGAMSQQLATVKYNIVAGADPGSIQLSLRDINAQDATFTERGSCRPIITVEMACNDATLNFYCPIDKADVNNDNFVNIADLGITATKVGILPAPALYDQNFDGVINPADLGLVASFKNKPVSLCP